MKLTARLVSGIFAVMVLLMAVDAYFSVRFETDALDEDMARDARQLGRTLQYLFRDIWLANGPESAIQLISEANQEETGMNVRWVWLDGAMEPGSTPAASFEKLRPALFGQVVQFKELNAEGKAYFFTYVPVDIPYERRGALELEKRLTVQDRLVRATAVRTGITAGVCILTGGTIMLLLGVSLVGRPLDRLIDKTRQIGKGDLTPLNEFHGRDELAVLGTSINTMCHQLAESREQLRQQTEARIGAVEQLRHADRLRTVGQLASGIAHELGTPLNIITGHLELLEVDGVFGDEETQSTEAIRTQCERMTKIIRQLLDFARQREPQREFTDLSELVRRTTQLLGPMTRKAGVDIQLQIPHVPLKALVDPIQVEQVVTNIIVNGIQATLPGGRLQIEIRDDQHFSETSDERYICIVVRDEGEGMDEAEVERVFDPFFTTKEVGTGTGLGLSIAHGIVQEHGGRISVESAPGQGTRFAVLLPMEVN